VDNIDKYQADLLYTMQFALWPESLLGRFGVMGSGDEISFLDSVSSDKIRDLLESMGKCSLWKAALRHRRWQFTSLVSLAILNDSDAMDGMQPMSSRSAGAMHPVKPMSSRSAGAMHPVRSLSTTAKCSGQTGGNMPAAGGGLPSGGKGAGKNAKQRSDPRTLTSAACGDSGKITPVAGANAKSGARNTDSRKNTAIAGANAKSGARNTDSRKTTAIAGANAQSDAKNTARGSEKQTSCSTPTQFKPSIIAEDALRLHAHSSERDINVYCTLAAESTEDPAFDERSLDSLSARLISAKLDMTPARSAALVAHGAGCAGAARDARRRGCSGRG